MRKINIILLLAVLIISFKLANAQDINEVQDFNYSDTTQISKNNTTLYLSQKNKYIKHMKKYINNKIKQNNVVGVTVSIVYDNDVLLNQGFGYADKKNMKPVTPLTVFRVASLSKLFTGIAIMQLKEKGLIDLDDPVKNYIPEFSYNSTFEDSGEITIRSLLCHQSGLIDKWKDFYVYPGPAQSYYSVLDFLKDEYVSYPTFYTTNYSNSGYALLGIIIDRVSGMNYNDYIKQYILIPNNMHFSDFELNDELKNNFTKAYTHTGNEAVNPFIVEAPAGNLYSTSYDMTNFIKMILNNGKLNNYRTLKKDTLKSMMRVQTKDDSIDFPGKYGEKHGLSWMLTRSELSYAGKYIGHGGILKNFYSRLGILPEHKLGVMISTNTDYSWSTSYEIEYEALKAALEIFKEIYKPKAKKLPPTSPIKPKLLKLMPGDYTSTGFGLVKIRKENNILVITSPFIKKMNLEMHTDGWFSLYKNNLPVKQYNNRRFKIKIINDKKIFCEEYFDQNGRISRFASGYEYNAPKNILPAWKEMIGKYIVVDHQQYDYYKNLTIFKGSDNILYIQHENWTPMVLIPHNSNIATVSGIHDPWGSRFNTKAHIRIVNGEKYLYHTGFIMKKIK